MYRYKLEVGKELITVGVFGTVIPKPFESCQIYLNSYFKYNNQVLLYDFRGLDVGEIRERTYLAQAYGSAFFINSYEEYFKQERFLALSLNAIEETVAAAHNLCESFQNAFHTRCCEGLIPQRMENLETLNFIATKV